MTVAAAIGALRHDSEMWDEVAAVTRRSGQEAGGLSLTEAQLSWASMPTGLLATYTEIQEKVAALLGEATEVYSELSAALDEVATAYELSDESAAQNLKGVWDVRE